MRIIEYHNGVKREIFIDEDGNVFLESNGKRIHRGKLLLYNKLKLVGFEEREFNGKTLIMDTASMEARITFTSMTINGNIPPSVVNEIVGVWSSASKLQVFDTGEVIIDKYTFPIDRPELYYVARNYDIEISKYHKVKSMIAKGNIIHITVEKKNGESTVVILPSNYESGMKGIRSVKKIYGCEYLPKYVDSLGRFAGIEGGPFVAIGVTEKDKKRIKKLLNFIEKNFKDATVKMTKNGILSIKARGFEINSIEGGFIEENLVAKAKALRNLLKELDFSYPEFLDVL
jgi:hypothetical protein